MDGLHRISLSVVAISAMLCGRALGQSYQLIEIPTFGGPGSAAYGISEKGRVTGNAESVPNSFGYTDSIAYVSNGAAINPIIGGALSPFYGLAVNNSGHVVGDGYQDNVGSRGFYYDGSTVRSVGVLNNAGFNQFSSASDVNNAGVVVGTSRSSFGVEAYRWTLAGGMVGLGKLGGVDYFGQQSWSSYGTAINNAGKIAGHSEFGQGPGMTRAVVWDPTTGRRDLGTFRGNRTTAIDISDSNLVLGTVGYDFGVIGPNAQSFGVNAFDIGGTSGRLPGIDVSHWQGNVNWDRAWASGVEYAIVKATESTNFVDPKLSSNLEKGTRAGVPMGVYHFARPSTAIGDAEAEANFFVDTIVPYVQAGQVHLRPVLDLEVKPASMSWQDLSTWADTFMQTLRTRLSDEMTDTWSGQQAEPILYLNCNYANNVSSSLTSYDLWLAHYLNDPQGTPNGGVWGDDWLMWQQTETGSVPGVSGNVDGNVLNESRSLDEAYLPGTFAPAKPGIFIHNLADGSTTYLGQSGNLNATAINTAGTVVGSQYDPETGEEQAVMIHNGQVTALQALVPVGSDLTLTQAWEINDAGQIVGVGVRGDGEVRGFVISPTASPDQITIVPVLRTPEPELVQVLAPTSRQLEVLGDGQIRINRPTIILTHGWNSNLRAGRPAGMADERASENIDANILAWDWERDANTGLLFTLAGSRTPAQGAALGDALFDILGAAYDERVHFIGHSFGSFVNRFAIDALHAAGFDPDNERIHTTLLDPADLGMTGNVSWAGAIPGRAALIDN